MKRTSLAGLLSLALAGDLAWPQVALAEIKVGATIAATGPAAGVGVPAQNTFALWPREIGGERLTLIVLDDGGDPSQATTNARRLITEDKVDTIIGSSTTPPTLAVAGVAFENEVPHFALAPAAVPAGRDKWTFVMAQKVSLMASAVFEHMKANKITTVGYIGFSDSWGDLWVKEFKSLAEPIGLKMVVEERYARPDTSVAGQALKLIAAKPDAILVGGSGTAAALPQLALRERGFSGLIYQTHGAVTKDFIRIAGKAAEGAILPSGPMVVADLLPESPQKTVAFEHLRAYEGKHGPDTRTPFAGHAWDVLQLLKRTVPVALKKAKPGTANFRAALHDALENEKDIAATHGVYNFTPTDHFGLDNRGRVLLMVKDGNWVIIN
jgi:branched-chain amino acid transport system substrate-binding protein